MPPLNLRELDLLKTLWCQNLYANWMMEVLMNVRIINQVIKAGTIDIDHQYQQLNWLLIPMQPEHIQHPTILILQLSLTYSCLKYA